MYIIYIIYIYQKILTDALILKDKYLDRSRAFSRTFSLTLSRSFSPSLSFMDSYGCHPCKRCRLICEKITDRYVDPRLEETDRCKVRVLPPVSCRVTSILHFFHLFRLFHFFSFFGLVTFLSGGQGFPITIYFFFPKFSLLQ